MDQAGGQASPESAGNDTRARVGQAGRGETWPVAVLAEGLPCACRRPLVLIPAAPRVAPTGMLIMQMTEQAHWLRTQVAGLGHGPCLP